MGTINLTNSKNRDSIVNTETVRSPMRVRYLDEKGRSARAVRLIRGTLSHDLGALVKSAGSLENVGDALIGGDPEIDLENFGKALAETSRVYISPEGEIMHRVTELEIVRNPDNSERERRPRKHTEQNTATETPLKWSGKMMKKSEVYSKFVFATKLQIVHVNGLTYDFLYGMAKELEAADSVMLMGAGPKSASPLVFQRNGTQYRGFLEGRTQGDKYCLVLHLSNMELKTPTAAEGR